MTRIKRLEILKKENKRKQVRLAMFLSVIFMISFGCCYKYIYTSESIRKYYIDLYDDSSTPDFDSVMTEIFYKGSVIKNIK